MIHRDIKPENILLHNGRAMVADFGIALAVSAAAGGRMTETGLSLGTPHYMSPEQATADKHITNRSDIYSLGSVLYEMLTGEPPHTGSSAQAIIMKIVSDEARPVRELRKTVPPHVAAAVAKAVEKLPADRFDSAKAFAEALHNPALSRSVATVGPRSRRLGRASVRHVDRPDRRAGRVGLAPSGPREVRRPIPYDTRRAGCASMESRCGWRRRSRPTGLSRVPQSADGTRPTLHQAPRRNHARPLAGTEGGSGPFFSPTARGSDSSRTANCAGSRAPAEPPSSSQTPSTPPTTTERG